MSGTRLIAVAVAMVGSAMIGSVTKAAAQAPATVSAPAPAPHAAHVHALRDGRAWYPRHGYGYHRYYGRMYGRRYARPRPVRNRGCYHGMI